MSDLQLLRDLQELDVQIEALNTALQEIESALGETDDLVSARAEVDNLRELRHDQEQRLRELEWSVEDLNRHVGEDEQKLYSGKVRNPKELEGLQRDVENRQARRRELEDRELQLMTDIESTESDLAQAQARLTDIRTTWEAGQRELFERQADVSTELAALRSKRSAISPTIPAGNLSLYEELRRMKRGLAVSKIERSTCTGCRIALPMGVIQHVRAGRELVHCPSCGRILYV